MAPSTDESAPWQPDEDAVERKTFQIFKVELLDVLGRMASAIDDFILHVETSFQHHPNGCLVSLFHDPGAERRIVRVGTLRGDAARILDSTIDYFATSQYELREPLTCKVVARLKVPEGVAIPRRAIEGAKLRGWFTPNERQLLGLLRLRVPVVLEDRASVDSRRRGLVGVQDENGSIQLSEDPNLAEADSTIAGFYPVLVGEDMSQYAMAVSEASLKGLRAQADGLRSWKPQLVRNRVLDPDWPDLVHTFATVLHPKPRAALGKAAVVNGGGHVESDLQPKAAPERHTDSRPPRRPPLSPKACAVLELLRALPPSAGLTGPRIIDALSKQTPPLHLDQSTLTKRVIPELKDFGVQNRPRIGYYLDAPDPPAT